MVLTFVNGNVELLFTLLFFILAYLGIDLVLIRKKIKQARTLFDELDQAFEDGKITDAEWNEKISPALTELFGAGVWNTLLAFLKLKKA